MKTVQNNVSIKNWSIDDRPREKLCNKGRHVLSNAELLAILIGSGYTKESAVEIGKRILHSCDNDLERLSALTVDELKRFKGIGEARSISIIAALELGRRRKESGQSFEKKESIHCSKDAYEIIYPNLADLKHEEFWVLYLSRANKVISKQSISKGGVTGTVADPRIIFKTAIDQLATSVVLCHNHPSGNLKPSTSDIELTKKIKAGGEMLDVAILDHLVITNRGYYSFADEGIL